MGSVCVGVCMTNVNEPLLLTQQTYARQDHSIVYPNSDRGQAKQTGDDLEPGPTAVAQPH